MCLNTCILTLCKLQRQQALSWAAPSSHLNVQPCTSSDGETVSHKPHHTARHAMLTLEETSCVICIHLYYYYILIMIPYRIAGNFRWVKFSLWASKNFFCGLIFVCKTGHMYVIAATFGIITGHTYLRDCGNFFNHHRAHVRDRGYFSNHHNTASNTRKVAADISKFSWTYFRFGALHNERYSTTWVRQVQTCMCTNT